MPLREEGGAGSRLPLQGLQLGCPPAFTHEERRQAIPVHSLSGEHTLTLHLGKTLKTSGGPCPVSRVRPTPFSLCWKVTLSI